MPATATFGTQPERRGPLTWGQQEIWRAIQHNRPHEAFISFTRTAAIPAELQPVSPARVAHAIGLVLERHESLRTLIDGPDDAPEQLVCADGSLELAEVEAAPELAAETAAELSPTLIETAFDYPRELPLRVLLIRTGASVSHAVFAYNHLASDAGGADLVAREVVMALRDRALGSPTLHPVDLARWQESEAGRRVATSAARYWDSGHELSPTSMFSPGRTRTVPPGDPVIVQALHTSRASDLALHELARRTRTSTSTVVLAATAFVVARQGGHATGAVAPIVGNRFRHEVAGLVGSLAQQGLFTLQVSESATPADFVRLLPGARAAALRAYRSGFHDPVDRFSRPVAGGGRVAVQQPFCCLNDQRVPDSPRPPADPAAVETALARTRLFWQPRPQHLDCLFCVGVSDHPAGLRLTVEADVRSVPREFVARFGDEIEALLVAAAFG